MVKVKEDMTGWIMSEHGVPNSRLIVIKQIEDYIEPNGTHRDKWICECTCETHKKIEKIGKDIRSGRILSCGCYRKEMMAKRNEIEKKKINIFSEKMIDEHGEYYIGYTSNTNMEFYIDADDFEKIKNYCWYTTKHNSSYQLCARVDGKHIMMHQLIGFKNYDHIDRNELNNRKYNFRKCNNQENSRNRGLQSNNTSGITGVSWNKQKQVWRSYIKVNGKMIHLGTFINKEDAIKSRLKAERQYFKEFAPQKHLYGQYGITT